MLGGLRHEHAQLGLGVDVALAARRIEPQGAQDELGRALKDPDQRPEHREERADRRRDDERGRLGVPERHALRNELADHDVQERDHEEGEDHREQRGHDRVEHLRQRVLAEGADREARQRDA